MTTVVLGERPPELESLLARRRALGLDAHDEVWTGTYHVAPHAHSDHGIVEFEVGAALTPRARDAGLRSSAAFNLGAPDDYRVPDGGLHRERPGSLYAATAALVVEVLSPGDETMAKLPFYAAQGVDELLVAYPVTRMLRLWRLTEGAYAEVTRSELFDVAVAELADGIDWP